MDGFLREGVVVAGGNARQQFHDARGYGTPAGGNEIRLSRVEAAHLLFRGDLEAVVVDGDDPAFAGAADAGERLDFRAFFVASAAAGDRFALRFLVYADLRDRGFYLSPARGAWPGGYESAAVGGAAEPPPVDAAQSTAETDSPTADANPSPAAADTADGLRPDLLVSPRGTKPGDGEPAYRIAVVGERASIPAADLGGRTLAVVDEESEISYLETGAPDVDGATAYRPPDSLTGSLLEDRVVLWDAPRGLYEHGFYGQPLTAREAIVENAVQLSLVEAAGLAAGGHLTLAGDDDTADSNAADRSSPAASLAAIRERGRAVEGERFDRRLAVYRALRDRGVVPKTGYKFGADFRTYDTVESVEDLPHSEHLVRVVEADHVFDPRDLSLDVRLAGGVRKRMVFALTGANGEIDWLAVSRLTP